VIDASIFDSIYHGIRWTWHDPDGYNIVSGPLADITLLGGAYAILRRHNCHAKGCWRIGRNPVEGTDFLVCRKHHPDKSPSAEEILAKHAEHKRLAAEAKAGRAEAVHDVRKVAHEVASDVHRVAEDVHKAEEKLEGEEDK
jgi:hypothetical protein